MNLRLIPQLAVCLGCISAAAASPVDLAIDPARSTADVTLCMTVGSQRCDSDRSPVTGLVQLELDCLTAPGYVSLYDLVAELTESTELNLNWGGFVGSFNGTADNIVAFYSDAGTPLPEAPVGGGTFGYVGVPMDASGQLNYTATNLVCLGLQAAGLACTDASDLSTVSVDPLDLDADLEVSGRTVTVTMNILVSAPLDPASPDLGYFSIDGVLVAEGEVPAGQYPLGDLDGDHIVDLFDYALWQACHTGPETPYPTDCHCTDYDQDGDADLRDFATLQTATPTP